VKRLIPLLKNSIAEFLFIRQRFFLLFVLCSFLFWSITKLSKTYQVSLPFNIILLGVPNTFVIKDKNTVLEINLTASGFDIIRYQWFMNQLKVSAEIGKRQDSFFVIPLREQQYFLQEQLLENTTLNGFKERTLNLAFSELDQKRVPIYIQANLDFMPGYLLDNGLKAQPDSIDVIGTKEILDTLSFIPTMLLEKNDVSETFTADLGLIPNKALIYNISQVRVLGAVSKYSEKQFQIPIKIHNLPVSTQIKLFPAMARLTVLARVDQFQRLKADDFELHIDYEEQYLDKSLALPIRMSKAPSGIKKVYWEPKQIEYLIKK